MAKPSMNQRLRGLIGSSFGADVVEQNIEKAIIAAQENARTNSRPISQFYDPYTMFFGREWLAKSGSPLSFNDLRMMAKNPIIGSIVNTRLNQVAAFCRPSNGTYEAGYEIIIQGEKDAAKFSKEKDYISQFIMTAGYEGYGDAGLEEFSRKFIRESLIMDQGTAEIVLRQNGLPAYMVAVDGATIRKLQSSLKFSAQRGEPVYAQVIDEVIIAEYAEEQMIYGIRNPSTDIRLNGYGTSELELLISVVTTLANAERYNSNSLAAGGTAKGLLVVKGDVEPTQLDTFKREFREAIGNAVNGWRPPVIRIGPEANVEWLPLDRSNKDMEYGQLFEFIVKLATGVFQISPEEVNWSIGATGVSTSFNSGKKDQLDYSKDKGLRPLLNFFGTQINHKIIHKLDPRFNMDFTGLGATRAEEVETMTKEVQYRKTLNEVRADANLPPIPGGDIVLNAQYLANIKPETANTDPTLRTVSKDPIKMLPKSNGSDGIDQKIAEDGVMQKSLQSVAIEWAE